MQSEQRQVSKKACIACSREFTGPESVCPHDGTILTPLTTDELVGTVLADRYEVLETIGGGGMGQVYKARHTLMNRIVAIKVLHRHLISSGDALKRFQLEAQAASCLSLPNILTIYDFGVASNGQPFMVMDYLEGTSLSTVLKAEGRLQIDRAVWIFNQACAGLAHAHKKGVIHRDLKPSNIMLVDNGDQRDFVKIVDFGIAKLLNQTDAEMNLTKTGEVFGSPLYMSPEQCRGKGMDARSDIYSLGCVMYRTISGSPVFEGEDVIELFYKQVHENPEPFSVVCPELNVHPGLEAIIFKCLHKDPADRWSTMEELQQALNPANATPRTQEVILPPIGDGNASMPSPHMQTPVQQAVTQRESTEDLHEKTSITGSSQRLKSAESQHQLLSLQPPQEQPQEEGTAPTSSPPIQTRALPLSHDSSISSLSTSSSPLLTPPPGSSSNYSSSESSHSGKRHTSQVLRKKQTNAEKILQNKAMMGVIIGAVVFLGAGATIGIVMSGSKPQQSGAINSLNPLTGPSGGTTGGSSSTSASSSTTSTSTGSSSSSGTPSTAGTSSTGSQSGIATKGIATLHPEEGGSKPNTTPTNVDIDDVYEQGKQSFERSNYKVAEEQLTHAAALMEKVHDKATAEKRIECLKLLVQTHCAQKHFPAANTTVAELRGDIEDSFGKRSLKLASALQQMAETYAKYEDDAKAKDLLVESLAIRDEKMSPGELKKDISTADAAFALAKLYQKVKKNHDAETQAKRTLAIRQEALGAADPSVAEVTDFLATVAPTKKVVASKKTRKVKKTVATTEAAPHTEAAPEQPKRRRAYSTYGF